MKKIAIYPKDIMLITGKSERYSRIVLKKIKVILNKKDHQVITLNELCTYLGITIEEALSVIK